MTKRPSTEGISGSSVDEDQPSQKSAGRPPYQPTKGQRKLVEALAAFCVPRKTIASLLDPPISHTTLERHFKDELAQGRDRVKARLMCTLLASADRGNTRALTFLIDRMCTAELPRPVQPIQNDNAQPLTVIVRGGLAAVEEQIDASAG